VAGLDAPAIADLAAAHGLPVHELVPRHASLEDAYLDITGDAAEYRTGTPGSAAPGSAAPAGEGAPDR
jgi:ABC-2 type transport system ATP-binding protein